MVRDPDTAEHLLPKTYGLGCKRQVLDRDYYDTFNRDNVTLVDLAATPIETITESGVRTSSTHHELDVLDLRDRFRCDDRRAAARKHPRPRRASVSTTNGATGR